MRNAGKSGKKTARSHSRSLGDVSDLPPFARNVPGRSALWADQRHPLLLGQEADAPRSERHADLPIHLCLCGLSPQDGRMDSLVLPEVSGRCMQIFLDEVAQRYPGDNIVMIVDGAGWHKSNDLKLPENLRLLFLPPYSPELNPQEHLWDELREKYFHNRAFDSLGALEDQLVAGLRALEADHARVKSIAGWEYIINSISNAI
ncbi:transposase [Acidithiobacillus ferrivorans]|uniref:transposase n=1 Tax=Acidithiobacillus ferrivorans TaxID=160808 RepID=UPI0037C0B82A